MSSLRRIHLLLGIQTLVVILVSINRLSTLTTGFVAENEFLRWVDLNNMLILPLISTAAFFLLVKQIEFTGTPLEQGSPVRRRAGLWLNLGFIIGIYLLAASYGDHEVTNYLHARFCIPDDGSALCRIVIFNDDEFSHWVFFAGFVVVNVAVMLYQLVYPHTGKLGRGDIALLALNGAFIGAGIFANLAFEVIGLDLYVVAFLAAFSIGLLWRQGKQPLFVYYSVAYGLGLVATFIYKGLA